MTPSRSSWPRRLWLAGGALLVLAVFAAMILWWLNTHTRIERTIDLPPQGEAAYNPLYLLRQALLADGVDADSRRYLQLDSIALAADDTVVLYGDPRQLTKRDVERLLNWVSQGGHLLVRLPTGGNRDSSGILLDTLGIRRMTTFGPFCRDIQLQADAVEKVFCSVKRFMLDDAPDVALGDQSSGYAFARQPWGDGSVDVLSHLNFLDNRQLGRPGNAALARQLLAPNYDWGAVHLIYGRQLPSLWRLLFEHARMVWIPLLLALAAWLWMRVPRLGPLRPAPLPARRALLEHIEASGEHLYGYGRADLLLEALRETYWRWLRRCDPLTASLQGKPRMAAIAARAGMPPLEVADALEADAQRMNAQQFCHRAAVLIQMMRH